MSVQRAISVVGLSAMSVFLSACNQAPRGDDGGIIDVRERTGADKFSEGADTVTLLEFADAVGQDLAGNFLTIPAIQQSQFRVTVELGSLQNQTRTPSSDFAAVQRRVFLTLANSDLVRKGARVVESRARVQRDAGIGGQPTVTQDPLGREAPVVTAAPGTYPLEDTYFLQGTFSELSRGGGIQSTYVFDFTLTNAASREIVFANQITRKQFRGS